jgi:Cof subfamily protein (haloacid dehalogenase superfamily)
MKNIKMIVTDLDGTLLSDKKGISDYTARVFNRCRKYGIRIVFATARPERTASLFIQKIEPDFIISNNGATIRHINKIIYNKFIPNSITEKLIQDITALKEIVCLSVESGGCLYTNYTGEPWEQGWNLIYTDFKNDCQYFTPKISVECTDAETLQNILAGYPELCLYSNRGENWYQIMSSESSKINAVSFIASKMDVSLTDIAAFGDDHSDIGMLKGCGAGIAVINGIDEAKLAADFICESNNSDGVAKWIESMILV